ncbi:hybrid sensor histidine kinase/response regulator [Oscillatoria sp. HE19RPO]|uniref:hybrid sensor histidine kinase/response regulator n=1 Tax=Oscillatoria sp. HE19RPO TaxID=2954806 RepID=UPI0020C4B35C|nr:hybrid sensor histidine kinase/response regulator [Oscillatoria sp. HE19RPO]
MTTEEIGLVLVIDDSSTNLELLSDLLTEVGYEVLLTKQGAKGIELAKSHPVDLILLDIIMPELDGFQTCNILQSAPETHDIPIIFMTGISDDLEKAKGLGIGAVDYITKPFYKDEILARIKIHIKLCRLTRELIHEKQSLEQRVEERTAELSQILAELQKAQLQLVRGEKLSSIGQLVAGVAHEIKNPLGFIAGNIDIATEGVDHLIEYLELYRAKFPDTGEEIQRKGVEIDIEYLLKDLPKMLASMKVGTDRISNLSTSLGTFCRSDTSVKVLADIHDGLDSTLMILQHRLKATPNRREIKVVKNYGEIPRIRCYLGQLNQVFMNIIANAIDALEEGLGNAVLSPDLAPQITINTQLSADGQQIVIQIADNGQGMTPEVKSQIFDYLFTTKPVGKGTGLGLSISLQIVKEAHNGNLTCYSELGVGTVFEIQIPLDDPEAIAC